MSEILMVSTAIFVGYIIYALFSSGDGDRDVEEKPAVKRPRQARQQPKKAPAKRPAATTKPTPQKKVAAKAASPGNSAKPSGIKHPKTGETVGVPSNYRFAKRWIKEAMVEEGVLDKIYKNNELDGSAGEKVNKALKKFVGMSKYHA